MKSVGILVAMVLTYSVFAHEHKAPHGGALIEFGEEFAHLELTVDKDGKVKAYALDGEAEKSVRLKQKTVEIEYALPRGAKGTLTLKAVASVLSGETEGDTSEFGGQDDKLKGVKEFNASV